MKLLAQHSQEQHGCYLGAHAGLAGKHNFKGVNCKDLPLLTRSHGAGLRQVPWAARKSPCGCHSPGRVLAASQCLHLHIHPPKQWLEGV